ncbi:MAG: hypothetical protein NTU76_03820 [Candidatus Taylorbacteria bacterium]|nr:hypothetical protein [Candidatus Taylorbacteria bacterium]
MTYFSRRNKHIVEYSGYEQVSEALRTRLLTVLNEYVGRNPHNTGDPWDVETDSYIYEVQKEFPGENPLFIIQHEEYHKVFTVIEIFLDMALGIYYTRRDPAQSEIEQSFELSGSVYTIHNRRVELKISEDLAEKIEGVQTILSGNSSAHEKFFEAVGNLMGRKAKSEDIVKDIFVAFEDYLKNKTGAKEYSAAVSQLEKNGIISPTQKALLEKIYAYRSDSSGVVHAGNGQKPAEIDALWFIETVSAQLNMIDNKLKQNNK